MVSMASQEMVPTPSLNMREPSGDLTSGMVVTAILFSPNGTAKGVSEKAWPILAAHLAGEVMREKLPRASIIVK